MEKYKYLKYKKKYFKLQNGGSSEIDQVSNFGVDSANNKNDFGKNPDDVKDKILPILKEINDEGQIKNDENKEKDKLLKIYINNYISRSFDCDPHVAEFFAEKIDSYNSKFLINFILNYYILPINEDCLMKKAEELNAEYVIEKMWDIYSGLKQRNYEIKSNDDSCIEQILNFEYPFAINIFSNISEPASCLKSL